MLDMKLRHMLGGHRRIYPRGRSHNVESYALGGAFYARHEAAAHAGGHRRGVLFVI
jgi:hypothetical protein